MACLTAHGNLRTSWFDGGAVTPSADYKHFEISAAGGVDWYHVPNTHLVVSPYESDTNQINKISTNGAWKVGVGYYLFENTLQHQHYLNHLLVEANVYQTFTTPNGNVWQFGQ
jgi:hypothetical protein